jgi:hypothetical protein
MSLAEFAVLRGRPVSKYWLGAYLAGQGQCKPYSVAHTVTSVVDLPPLLAGLLLLTGHRVAAGPPYLNDTGCRQHAE